MTSTKPYDISKRRVLEAYRHVRANRGAAGIDDESIEMFEADLSRNLYKLWNRMASGSYFPPPVRQVEIPKKQGGVRILGVPTFSSNCTYRQYAFGMGRGLSPLSPATGPAFSCAKDAALIRAGDADSARSDARHPQCAA
jgi:hypothetical protein